MSAPRVIIPGQSRDALRRELDRVVKEANQKLQALQSQVAHRTKLILAMLDEAGGEIVIGKAVLDRVSEDAMVFTGFKAEPDGETLRVTGTMPEEKAEAAD